MSSTTSSQRSRPRKAPKQARSHETVKVLVEAAACVLEQHGHDGFSTNAVAARAGVSIGSLYQYFPRKDALIGELILRETSRLLDEVGTARAEPAGVAGISLLIRASVAHQLRRPTLARLLDFEEARLPFEADTQEVGQQLHAITRELLGRPDLPPQPDAGTAAQDVLAIIKGMVDAAGVKEEREGDVLTGRVRQAVFGYLYAPPVTG